jgi:hypothetical protein
MCDEEAADIGAVVPDETVIYRACTRKNCLSGTQRDFIEAITFQKEGQKHKDGLSLALSAEACARFCPRNFGIVKVTAGAIHHLNRGIEVHFDTADTDHVIVRNLPCIDRENEKEMAHVVSSEIAAASEIESNQHVDPPKPQPTSTPLTPP